MNSRSNVFGWYFSARGGVLHYFQYGKSLCRRVTYSWNNCEPRAAHAGAPPCQLCAMRAKDKPESPEVRQSRLFG